PITRFLAGPSVMRPSPDSNTLRLAFTRTETRTQRKSDGTIVIEGRRLEVPDRYRHLTHIEIRYASWDLSHVYLVDKRTGMILCRLYPHKRANASGLRRARDPVSREPLAAAPETEIPPLLRKLLKEQADTGLPPAYLPKDERDE